MKKVTRRRQPAKKSPKMTAAQVNKLFADVLEASDKIKALRCCVQDCSCDSFAPSPTNPVKCRRKNCRHHADDHGCG